MVLALGIVIEAALFALSVWLVFNLMMPVEKKLVVVLSFAFRLPWVQCR